MAVHDMAQIWGDYDVLITVGCTQVCIVLREIPPGMCWLVDAINDFCNTFVPQSLQAMAWLSAEELTRHPNGDSFLVSCHQDCHDVCTKLGAHHPEIQGIDIADLSIVYMLLQAVAGTAGEIAIISLVEARVVSLLKGDCIYSSVWVIGKSSIHHSSEGMLGSQNLRGMPLCELLHCHSCSLEMRGDAVTLMSGIIESSRVLPVGHPGAVVSLATVPRRPGMLASLGRDGTVRFWDAVLQQRLATVPAEATAMVRLCPTPQSCLAGMTARDVH